MVLKCAFPSCPNRENPARVRESLLEMSSRLSFHKFPLYDCERMTSWLLALKRDVHLPTRHVKLMRVCSEHFLPEDFQPNHGKTRHLKPTAVPRLEPQVRVSVYKHKQQLLMCCFNRWITCLLAHNKYDVILEEQCSYLNIYREDCGLFKRIYPQIFICLLKSKCVLRHRWHGGG